MSFCSKCGNSLNEGAKFCGKCGHNFVRPISSTATHEPTPAPSQNAPEAVSPSGQSHHSPAPPPPYNSTHPPHQYNHAPTPVVTASEKPKNSFFKKGCFIAFLAVLAVVAIIVVLVIIGTVLGPDDRNAEPVGEAVTQQYETTPTPDETQRTELTAREVFVNNVDAVFTVYMRLPAGMTVADAEQIMGRLILYPLSLPSGDYIGIGSGFFVNSDGVAVTNHHVVVGHSYLVARTHADGVYPILGYYSYDTGNDIAIIQVEGNAFQYVTFADTPVLETYAVYAIGSPDGDRLTFTDGIVSRFVERLIFAGTYMIYEVYSAIQFTAAIYGGNSGGPLFNHYGQVVGIVSAGILARPSANFAVPIDRVDLSGIDNASVLPFPLTPPHAPVTAEILAYQSFEFIPTFGSISEDAEFLGGGDVEDFGLDEFGYERVYFYSLSETHVRAAIDQYEVALGANGFIWQDTVNFYDTGQSWVYFYNPTQSVSLSMWYTWSLETMAIAIGRGNIFEQIYGSEHDAEQTQTPTVDASQLVGMWEASHSTDPEFVSLLHAGYVYLSQIFEDGTGALLLFTSDWNLVSGVAFSWTLQGDQLRMESIGGIQYATITVSSTTLTSANDDGSVLTSERVVIDDGDFYAFGVWQMISTTNLNLQQSKDAGYVFFLDLYLDGSGIYYYSDPSGQWHTHTEFNWRAHDGSLELGELGTFSYQIFGVNMVLSRDGITFTYVRFITAETSNFGR